MIAKTRRLPASTIGGQKEGIQMTSRLIARTGLIGVAVAFAVGAVYATIPDAGGAIHGCYNPSGNLRVIDDSVTTCRPNETGLEWSGGGSQVFTVGANGNGTANDLTVPGLGTLHADCAASVAGSITLTGDALFTLAKVTDLAASQGSPLRLNLAAYSSSGPETLGSNGADLWVTNVQGQWRFEYYNLPAGGPMGNQPPCQAGAVITRIG